MRKLLLLMVAVLVGAMGLVAVACGSGGTDTTGAPEDTTGSTEAQTGPIKIGHIVNLTGPQAMVGQLMESSVTYAFEQIGNEIAGRPIEIIVGDGKDDPAATVELAKKMVEEDGVVAFLGPTGNGQKLAMAEYIKTIGIPMILYNPTPPDVFEDNQWVVGSGGTVLQYPSVMADYAYNTLGYRTVHTLSQDNTAGRAFIDPFTELFTQLGGTVVSQQWVPVPCTDFAPFLTTLADADALVAWDAGSDAIGLFTQWQQLGVNARMPILGTFHGGFTDPFIPMALSPEAATAAMGTLSAMAFSPDSQDEKVQAFMTGLGEKLGYPPGDGGVSGPYQAALLLQAALEATSGNTTPSALIAAIMAANIVGPEGPESFADGQQAATKNIYVVEMAAVPGVEGQFMYKTVFTYENVPPAGLTK
jgi:branched-chain amino acid transport system substrate-binding protein